MNLVLDDAEEYHMKLQTRKPLGRIPIKEMSNFAINSDVLDV